MKKDKRFVKLLWLVVLLIYLLMVITLNVKADDCLVPDTPDCYSSVTPFEPTATNTVIAPSPVPTATATFQILPLRRYVYMPVVFK